jgi:hypothetical protein
MSVINFSKKLGYGCPKLCVTQMLLEEALIRLVSHDRAADSRNGNPSCIELQNAVEVLKDHCGYTEIGIQLCKDLP